MGHVISDQVYSVALAPNAGPQVQSFELNLPDIGNRKCFAWISNFGSSNVHLLEGNVILAQAQRDLLPGVNIGAVDLLMTLSGSAVTECPIPDTLRQLTIFFEANNTSGQNQVVTFRVRVIDE